MTALLGDLIGDFGRGGGGCLKSANVRYREQAGAASIVRSGSLVESGESKSGRDGRFKGELSSGSAGRRFGSRVGAGRVWVSRRQSLRSGRSVRAR